MKEFFTIVLLFATGMGIAAIASPPSQAPLPIGAQNVIELRSDTVMTVTLQLSQNTLIIGNGYSIRCDGCAPVIYAQRGVTLCLDDVKFVDGYETWMAGPDDVYKIAPRKWRVAANR